MSESIVYLAWCRPTETPGVEFRVENIMGVFHAEARLIGRGEALNRAFGESVEEAVARCRAKLIPSGVAAALSRAQSARAAESVLAECLDTRLDPHRGSDPAAWRGPAVRAVARGGNKFNGQPVPDPLRSIDALIADAKAERAAAFEAAGRWIGERWLEIALMCLAAVITAAVFAAHWEPLR